MPSPIRHAFVAALAALALSACSGGGGGTPAATGAERSDILKPGQLLLPAYSAWQGAPGSLPVPVSVPPQGTLENLLGGYWEEQNFPQFSEFEFGAATNANGIPLQKATKTEAGRYAAVAYQAVLEQSMFLLQGGIYNYRHSTYGGTDTGLASFSTGNRYTGSPIAGTWKGKAVAIEEVLVGGRPSAVDLDQAERLIVQGDVEIVATVSGSRYQNLAWEFSNWEGGSVAYPDVSSRQHPGALTYIPAPGNNHFATAAGSAGLNLPENALGLASLNVQFYGPSAQEVGGAFQFFRLGGGGLRTYQLSGVYGAKKE